MRRGYGGASTTTRRMGSTVRTTGRLYDVLSSGTLGESAEPNSRFDFSGLAGRSADEIMDVLVERVRPVDGTQDADAGRVAIRNALSDLLDRFPEANLLLLSEEECVYALERYVALDVYHLFHLDVGKTVQANAPSASDALSRLKDIKDYVVEAISSRFRALMTAGKPLTATYVSDLARQTLQQTFEVFEAYVL